jgi:hypothetical protein
VRGGLHHPGETTAEDDPISLCDETPDLSGEFVQFLCSLARSDDRDVQEWLQTGFFLYQQIWPQFRKKPPVGPLQGSIIAHTGVLTPSSTERVLAASWRTTSRPMPLIAPLTSAACLFFIVQPPDLKLVLNRYYIPIAWVINVRF